MRPVLLLILSALIVGGGASIALRRSPQPAAEPDPAPPRITPKVEAPRVAPPAEPAEPVEWHCLCYEARLQSTGEMQTTTACRPIREECARLEAMVRSSTGRFSMGAEGRRCRTVRGRHPMDALGGAGGWRHSDHPGSWVFPGQCMLR